MPANLNRRQFMQYFGAGVAALAAPRFMPAAATTQRRPNIVVVLCDDMGFSDIGCYGSEIATPNLDALAAGGLRFSQFYNTARCCPTRACVLTGLYPHQAGVGHMMEDRGLEGYQGCLNHQCATIAEVLKPAGYGTYAVGKWHVSRHDTPTGAKDNWPLQRGFDRYYGTLRGAGNYFDPGSLMRDNTMISPLADPLYKPDEFYYTHAITEHACRFIDDHHRQQDAKPFFMYVAYTCAHWPMHALERDIARYKGKYDGGYEPIRARRFARLKELGLINPAWDLSPQQGDWSKVAHKAWEARCMEVYAAMIDAMDQGIGRIVKTLRDSGQLDNTLILFLQDNGGCQEAIGRAGNMTRPAQPTLPKIAPDVVRLDVRPTQNRAGIPTLQGPNIMPGPEDTYISYGMSWANVSNTPFREYKHFVHEGGISTPLIAHWPAGIDRRGQIENQSGHLIDIMATCVDLGGAEYPAKNKTGAIPAMEGRSLVPAFAGKPIQREAIFWEHEGNRALRVGKWKLVAKNPAGKWELYDMEKDRTEMHDLAAAQPYRVKEMSGTWAAWAKRTHALPWPWRPQYGVGPATMLSSLIFDLKSGDDLRVEEAPPIVGRSIRISATLTALGEGVIVAQGGTRQGYALYIKDGILKLSTRHNGTLMTVAAPAKLDGEQVQVQATLARDGTITLRGWQGTCHGQVARADSPAAGRRPASWPGPQQPRRAVSAAVQVHGQDRQRED